MRGEEKLIACPCSIMEELPPHARRRVKHDVENQGIIGITSACAEKSETRRKWNSESGNYLRMRGEETALPAETLAVGVVL